MVDIGLLQSLSYVAAAIGVCAAAFYYVMMLRNMENTRRKDIISQRLQMPLQFYEANAELLYSRNDFGTFEEFREKYWDKPKEMAKVWYVINHYNSLGILIQENLATPQQIFMQYLPISIIIIYEAFRGEMVNARYRHEPTLEVHNPDAYSGFQYLYREALRLYPRTPVGPWTREELIRHAREIDELLKSGKAQ